MLGVKTASQARGYLELLTPGRSDIIDDRFLDQKEIERRLELMMHNQGGTKLNELRDKARKISYDLGLEKGFKHLEGLIGTLLGTKEASLESDVAIARSQGLPFDKSRNYLFAELFAYLVSEPMIQLNDHNLDNNEHFTNKAFFESYFSNYIEGTIFLIEEAERIIFENQDIPNRLEDSHDISGTYKIVSNQSFMCRTPSKYESFINDLKYINLQILEERKNMSPGEFKIKANQAGNVTFVLPELVEGTLLKGYEYYETLKHPLAKAIFASFLVSEVHPFNDGNGRTSRVVLNRELLAAGMPSIIIPTVFRNDYLGALKLLSKKSLPGALVRMFSRALSFSNLDFSNYSLIKKELVRKKWFHESDESKIID
ncbi:MAG: Fic family protein [Deltaproteobacteria bacterium]|nr:Fic family protein [Deltaproteobacteria bacterium]